tara:strand:- start:285 stop:635 length:351 start_codon:yes stop_codon:yes gene_type:complete
VSLQEALFMFLCGVLAHSIGIRLFGVWTKSLFYKLTFVNCLIILKMTEETCKKFIGSVDAIDQPGVQAVFEHWQKMVLFSLRSAIPDPIWKEVSVNDWEDAMKLLLKIQQGAENEN